MFGASGYIGSHLAEQLQRAGMRVVAPLRRASTFLHSLGIAQPLLDFTDDDAIGAQIPATSTVYLCLANPRRHLPLDALRQVEVHLTARIIRAAARAGARRVVLLSTVMVYGFKRPPHAIDELWPPAPLYPFNRVALEREEAARAAACAGGIELVIARPANTLGRRDQQMAPLFAAARLGLFPLFGSSDWRFSAIDARDLGRALHFLGTLPEAASQCWLIKGYDTSWSALRHTLEQLNGRRTLPLRLPRRLALGLGQALETLLPHGIEPPLSRFAVEVMATHTLFDSRKIEAAGYAARYGLQETLAECLRQDQAPLTAIAR